MAAGSYNPWIPQSYVRTVAQNTLDGWMGSLCMLGVCTLLDESGLVPSEELASIWQEMPMVVIGLGEYALEQMGSWMYDKVFGYETIVEQYKGALLHWSIRDTLSHHDNVPLVSHLEEPPELTEKSALLPEDDLEKGYTAAEKAGIREMNKILDQLMKGDFPVYNNGDGLVINGHSVSYQDMAKRIGCTPEDLKALLHPELQLTSCGAGTRLGVEHLLKITASIGMAYFAALWLAGVSPAMAALLTKVAAHYGITAVDVLLDRKGVFSSVHKMIDEKLFNARSPQPIATEFEALDLIV